MLQAALEEARLEYVQRQGTPTFLPHSQTHSTETFSASPSKPGHLQERVDQLQVENSGLKAAISSKDAELQRLCR